MLVSIATGVAFLVAGTEAVCSHNTHLYPRNTVTSGPQFTYTGLTGPLNWHSLNVNNSKCARGTQQTPINLDGTVTSIASATVVLDYPHTLHAEFKNLGTTIEVECDDVNGTLKHSGKTWKLKQFHFHTPSEHRIEDEFYPGEVHFVHEGPNDTLAVLGFVLQIGANNDPLLEQVLPFVNQIPHKDDHTEVENLDFSVLKQHLATNAIYKYKGSLTTPPCSQDVQWFISKKPLTVDFLTFNKVKKIVKFNARYTQNRVQGTNLLLNAKNTL